MSDEDPTVTCPCCGDTHAAPGGDSRFLERGISKCDVCGALIVYGEVAPKVVVEPSTFDTPFGPQPAFILRTVDRKTNEVLHELKQDPQSAFLIAQAIISMVRP